jgi:ribosomal protein L12E/L44/L45/RPP1/RPP2
VVQSLLVFLLVFPPWIRDCIAIHNMAPAEMHFSLACVRILSQVINELKGKNVEEVIAEGNKKLASVPSGGAVAAAPAAAAAAAPAAAAAAPAAKAPPKKKTTSDEDMGFGLFD